MWYRIKQIPGGVTLLKKYEYEVSVWKDGCMMSKSWYDRAWDNVVEKIDKNSDRIKDGLPHVSVCGRYDDMSDKARWWTNGFWPGILWTMYRETGDIKYKIYALGCERKLDEPLDSYHQIDHDAGFLWILASKANYLLTGDMESRRRAMTAASHLASRFNPAGDFIRAWDWVDPETGDPHTGWAIIDCMMNLPLLFWASKELEDPRFKHVAMKHADMVLREFIREDGSVHHIVSFDPDSGDRIRGIGGQGYSEDSAWSRGAAWAIYGMALAYKYTGQERYLDASMKVADFFISQLPEDYMPLWDFWSPEETHYAKDSSAAACAASGMLEISELIDGEAKETYRSAGEKIIRSLYENYGAWDENDEALIKMGTVNLPKDKFINVPIIYGDFYFMESILKLKGVTATFW